VLALAVGIGASLTAGVVAYAGLARPLPFPRGGELVTIVRAFDPTHLEGGVSLLQFEEWRTSLAPIARLIASVTERTTLRSAGEPREIHATYVLGPYFETLDVRPVRGRLLLEHDAAAAVVTKNLAARLAGTAEAAIGRPIVLGTRSYSIVGIAPDALLVLNPDVDVWVPARSVEALDVFAKAQDTATDDRDYAMVARLLPDQTASALYAASWRTLVDQLTRTEKVTKGWHIEVAPLRQTLIGDLGPTFVVIAAAAGLLLLIAAANVAMLLANRSVARQREFAVRLALGAGSGRLVRSTILETALVALAAAIAGWGLALAATAWLSRQTGLALPSVATFHLAWPLAAGAALAMLFVAVACSAVPVLIARGAHLSALMRVGTSTATRGGQRTRATVVTAQFAMMTMLLTGVGLLGRTLVAVGRTDLGIAPSPQLLVLRLPLGESTRPPSSRAALVDEIITRVRALPGVTAAGIGSSLPPHDPAFVMIIRYISSARDDIRKFDTVSITDGYLDALGVRLVGGRLFQPADAASAEPVAVLSEAALRHSGRGLDSIGQALNVSLPSPAGRVKPKILGVIRDVRFSGMTAPPNGGIYVLWRQIPVPIAYLVVRGAGGPAALAPAITQIVRAIDPSMPLAGAHTFDEDMSETLAPWTSRFALLATFGVGAVLLAGIGLFGALAQSVAERQRELAIRAAIGAAPGELRRSVLRRGIALAVVGLAVGLLLSAAAGREISSVLFGVRPHDPLTYAATAGGVLLIGFLGCYVPGRRAADTDPAVLLRAE
jgi:predicted permease